MRILFFLMSIIVSCVAWAATPAEMLQERLSLLHTLEAKYIQTSYDASLREKKVVSGKVVMERSNKFRWTVEKPYHQVLLSDGKKFYIDDQDLDQVVIRPLMSSVQDAPALLLIGKTSDVSKDFNVRHSSLGTFQDVFVLIPKDKESMLKSIELAYQGSALQSMRFHDTLDQVVDIQFIDLQINAPLEKGAFTLVIKEGVDVIEE